MSGDDQVWAKIETYENGQYHCLDCGYLSINKRSMYEHVESKHVVSEGHVCPLDTCGKVCRTKNALRSHMVRIHGTSKIPRGGQIY